MLESLTGLLFKIPSWALFQLVGLWRVDFGAAAFASILPVSPYSKSTQSSYGA